ncbi:hypothetical protein KMW28_05090 [Flammeovirga yaeyamensis]|uniref:YD repeat-containing protein n=1 Tax=Flammeovirga yaeyamensis TaxID=367791 RepID=A0AAX1N6W3_9BACT|nr:hypothetical protein [Flammeovirga yaeyamensis]MBB3697534.1 hypothetical protein [Flammeovirga yaeyamensis]NMF36228.1 hypothetical protein [Flammeovirga yaeyamensis]QWG02957.1 hypothetical protein KMW28_05090 [Flammeovirga yaeyamensis]
MKNFQLFVFILLVSFSCKEKENDTTPIIKKYVAERNINTADQGAIYKKRYEYNSENQISRTTEETFRQNGELASTEEYYDIQFTSDNKIKSYKRKVDYATSNSFDINEFVTYSYDNLTVFETMTDDNKEVVYTIVYKLNQDLTPKTEVYHDFDGNFRYRKEFTWEGTNLILTKTFYPDTDGFFLGMESQHTYDDKVNPVHNPISIFPSSNNIISATNIYHEAQFGQYSTLKVTREYTYDEDNYPIQYTETRLSENEPQVEVFSGEYSYYDN